MTDAEYLANLKNENTLLSCRADELSGIITELKQQITAQAELISRLNLEVAERIDCHRMQMLALKSRLYDRFHAIYLPISGICWTGIILSYPGSII
ncbi:MAG: hypothetical protein JEZ07_19820 [Phycisphaerae bacterium]|nr:hypothetical protein [Phycisphaerae bacterium]